MSILKFNLNKNMQNDTKNAICPECGKLISIDAALTKQIQVKLSKDFEEKQKALKNSLEKDNQVILAKKELELRKQTKDSVERESKAEMKLMQERLVEMNVKVKQANQNELELRKEKQKLKDAKDVFELESIRKLDIQRKKIEEDASRKATEAQQSKIDQLNKQLRDATRMNVEQARKLEQGSQQTQGEVQEIILEDLLKSAFIYDDISPVPKGINGADVIQTVKTKTGIECGKIIWESKKTKSWTKGWIQKLKDDQRLVKAEIAVIVSSVLPEGVESGAFRDGVWMCDIKHAVFTATALRHLLETVSREKAMSVGKNDNKEILYNYVTGTAFTQKMQAIGEAFFSMHNSLSKERSVQEKLWLERAIQIQKISKNVVGILSDLKLSGTVPLQKIEFLELSEPSKD